MNLYNIILYNIIIQYLFFCLLITITKSQQLQYKYFNYTESDLGDQNASFHIVDIKTYDDGTILVHIIRNESTQTADCSKIRGMSLEKKLRIRLIFLNGTVKEIDPKLKLELDPINYCLLNSDNIECKIKKLNYLTMYLNDTIGNNSHKNLVNPITIYPLRKPFLLVTYVKTINSSDPRTYEECGEVIDWNGTSTSDEHGNLTNTTNLINKPKISDEDSNMNYSLIAIVPTVENEYLAIFNYTNPRSIITPRNGLCAIPISYDQTRDNQKRVIFQTEQPINSVSCDETDSFVICIIFIHFNNGTFNETLYKQIQIYPSGIEFSTHEIYLDQQSLSLRAKMTSFGDLTFDFTEYNNADKNIYYDIYYYNASASRLEPLNSFIITNYFSINAVTQNHTFLLTLPNAIDNISWSLLLFRYLIPMVEYANVFINKTIPSINDSVNSSTNFLNITFNRPVALSAPTSNITIYKASDNSIRQMISTTMHVFISISSDGFTVNAEWDEPLRGIHDGIWILKSDIIRMAITDIVGLVRLTQEASKKFSAPQNNQSAYINSLLNDIAKKVPINRFRLSSNNTIQKSNQDQILIPINIDAYTEWHLASDLSNMIEFKKITTISFGLTYRYNFQFGRLMI
ncbi:hypothetical protein F8M41_014106 [Gigaspora margarita]|uniref:Uncharacterized protein n=1 Tax=Gigaspora margarita TaxID=4874 RepID=A0A8H4AS38_GIGMA|nr:hypothetical protein F8M41_014106 [Gigaspora margarita]